MRYRKKERKTETETASLQLERQREKERRRERESEIEKKRNEEVWNHLPLPAWTSPVNALPGSEIFLEVSLQGKDSDDSQESRIPVLAGKRVGAGKSFYLGFDESWRWRYEVADLYH